MSQTVVTLGVCLLALSAQIRANDCKLPNGSTGDCVSVISCPSALDSIKNRQKPSICGFKGTESLVCCERSGPEPVPRKSQQFCDTINGPSIASVGGVDALPREFRHMAVLGYGDNVNDAAWICGGSLISNNFILTAAHCLASRALGPVKFVRLGDLNIKLDNDTAEPQDFNVVRTIRHPDYKSRSKYHDIALIQMDRDYLSSDYVKPACLYTERQPDVSTYIATGWGLLGFTGDQAKHLQKVTVQEVPIEKCRSFYVDPDKLSEGIVGDWQICAGDKDKDTCQGDSGGPLQQRNKNYTDAWNIYGLVSFGKACGLSKAPGIYTRVSNYIDWIESIVWPN